MAGSGWPIFAEWAAKPKPFVNPPPPRSYLDKFNKATEAWLRRVDGKAVDVDVPAGISGFLEDL